MSATTLIIALCALACPVGMGLMMWLMGRGMRHRGEQSPPSEREEERR